ncbi:glycine zipper 2TM domain-containing protein [Ramlibacter ginsenosidimutans]|uniref:Glycine zipper 2TM domain-containing protein n=1 Tax=Ramlibacter ginsenosidimutans TaxID=502333 RepID=A0A934TVQ9_9BURK|nr:glycine zipper 2TM domain-containing protein [Ramlibacter ginsenosidimutans]MBK6008364.1 glycine zipper 2TM domain-containing protein [Ramlibacter ginsenosidimutans]
MNLTRFSSVVVGGIAAATLAACSSYGPTTPSYSNAPTYNSPAAYPAAGTEYGRIVNIEYMPVGTNASPNASILGAVVGGVAGGLLGSTIGAGSGRAAATVLGAVGGAAVGQHLARNQSGATTQAGYRITMQSDQGVMRTYEVPATGDLRVGDRVRVDNGVIYRA